MSSKDSDRDTITGFFRDDAEGISGFLNRKGPPGKVLSFKEDTAVGGLQVPKATAASDAERKAYWRTLRAFFRTGKGGGIPLSNGKLQAFPALLSPFRGKAYIQYGYPCWVADTGNTAGAEWGGAPFHPLSSLLKMAVEKAALPEGPARILTDNLLRLEGIIRAKVHFADGAFAAGPVFQEALEELEGQLAVRGEEGKAFSKTLARMKAALPQTGVLIPFSAQAPLHLLAAVIRRQLADSRRTLRVEIAQLGHQLEDILAVEREKSPESQSAEHLHSALDFADTFLNFEELSAVLPSGGSEAMPEERHHRIEMILDTLHQAEELLFRREAFVVAGEGQVAFGNIDWKSDFPGFEVHPAEEGRLSLTTSRIFDEEMGKAARVFAALRIGHLEANNQYVPEMHSDFFAYFDWRSFNEQELSACAPVLLLSDAEALLEKELNAFSRQLASGLPVKYLVAKSQRGAEAAENGQPGDSLPFRRELGALAIAHRDAFVLQSPAIRPEYLNEGFIRGVRLASPALFFLLSVQPGEEVLAEPGLWASAAVEGRDFPGFTFDSQLGPKWGSRFDIRDNPQPEADWPVHQLKARQGEGAEKTIDLPFTFADFAVLDSHYSSFFHIVPPEYWTESLVPLAAYLELPGEEAYTRVPFIWLADEQDRLQRAAVAWPLVLACRERLDFWHYLQENAGIHSYHVEQATEQLRRELEQSAAEKLEKLQASHEAAVENAREEAARNAMEHLASVLLDMDVDAVVPTGPVAAAPASKPVSPSEAEPKKKAPEPKAQATAAPVPKPKEEPQEDELVEAWVETPLCTSCNECIDTNKNIFQYNADKQAFVSNPKGGPFADIVQAAEKCPVRIIHPGSPQNPKEENLEEWVKRAEPYQG